MRVVRYADSRTATLNNCVFRANIIIIIEQLIVLANRLERRREGGRQR